MSKKQCTHINLKPMSLKNTDHHLSCQWVVITSHRHHVKYSNNGNIWNIVEITKMWCGDTKWANAVGKWHQQAYSTWGATASLCETLSKASLLVLVLIILNLISFQNRYLPRITNSYYARVGHLLEVTMCLCDNTVSWPATCPRGLLFLS